MNRGSERRTGFTLAEAVLSIAVLFLALTAAAVVLHAIIQRSLDPSPPTACEREAERALSAIVSDLSAADSRGKDAEGKRYLEVLDSQGGKQNSLVLRKVVGYSVSEDFQSVGKVFGTPIQYCVRGGELVRTQDGKTSVVARAIKDLSFAVSPAGTVKIVVTALAEEHGIDLEVTRRASVNPQSLRKRRR